MNQRRVRDRIRKCEPALHLCVVKLYVAFGPVEHGWSDRKISGRCEIIGDVPSFGIDAEYFLQHHDPAARTSRRSGQIC
jgi:hypothetical protein